MTEQLDPKCAICGIAPQDRACMNPDGKGPDFCPTQTMDQLKKEALAEYHKPSVREFARLASIQEAECYLDRDVQPYVLHAGKTRIQEVCEFAQKIEAKKIGLAFCMGLAAEARMLNDIFTKQGFEVISVGCKAGNIPKEEIGVQDDQKIHIGHHESACNPILQAKTLNYVSADLNVLVGLCVGHDALFLKYVEGYTTVLAVKDRVTGHSPLAPLYTSNTYHAYLKRKGF